jgi:glycosyltransferase involved in cell wall biosynthesis
MRLLVITQIVDSEDTVLGFFHGWLIEFSKHVESLTVICLKEGKHQLPKNVQVLSLGKEGGISHLKYIFRFYKYIFNERRNYDSVFVHMNQEYVLLGGIFWRFWGKKIGFWYNHTFGTLKTDAACFLADVIFHVSQFAYTAKKKKAIQMPAGIDINFFQKKESVVAPSSTVLFLGRISPVKKTILFVEAVEKMYEKAQGFYATVCGDIASKDREYGKLVYEAGKPLVQKGILRFIDGVPHEKTRDLYFTHDLYVNLTQTGSLDKTILEAIACESLVLTSNQSFLGILPDDEVLPENTTSDEIASRITLLSHINKSEKDARRRNGRQYVVEKHSLSVLISRVIESVS